MKVDIFGKTICSAFVRGKIAFKKSLFYQWTKHMLSSYTTLTIDLLERIPFAFRSLLVPVESWIPQILEQINLEFKMKGNKKFFKV